MPPCHDRAVIPLKACVLGTFQIELDGRLIEARGFPRTSAKSLVQLLLLRPSHRLLRDDAIDTLWPDLDPEHGATNLRKALHYAREALRTAAGTTILASDGPALQFGPEVELDLDLDRIVAAFGRARRLPLTPTTLQDPAVREALDLGARTLLPDERYEDWAIPVRERTAQAWQALAVEAAEVSRAAGDADLAATLVDRLLDLDAADEAAHQIAIRLHLDGGRMHDARRQLALCRSALARELGVAPAPETEALVRVAPPPHEPSIRPPISGEAALVGRASEIERIESVLDESGDGRASGLLIRGVAGIGKTRLLERAAELADANGYRLVTIRGLEATRDMPMAPIAAALSRSIGGAAVDDWPEPARSGALAIAPGLSLRAGPRLAFATSSALAAGVVDALRRLVGPRSALILDDIQWLDDATVGILAAAISEGVFGPVFASLRDGPGPGVGPAALLETLSRAAVRTLEVGRLRTREVEEIAARTLGGAQLAAPLAAAVVELADGHPLFLIEVVRLARERGSIQILDGEWNLVDAGRGLEVPDTVVRLIEARTGLLPEGDMAVLTAAAELGDPVSFEALVRVAPERGPDDVLASLDAGIRAGLLVEAGHGYAFAHPLFRAALRRTLKPGARAALHLAVARALAGTADIAAASTTAAAGPARPIPVALHALDALAGGLEAARSLAVVAGLEAMDQFGAVFDHGAVVGVGQRVRAAWDGLPAEERVQHAMSTGLVRTARSLTALGREPEAIATLKLARGLARTAAERAAAGREASWLPYRHGDFGAALRILDTTLQTLADEEPHARATVEQQIGWIQLRRGDIDAAAAILERCLATFETAGDDEWTLQMLDKLGVARSAAGRQEEAIGLLRRSIDLARARGDARAELPAAMHIVTAYGESGLAGPARMMLQRALELARLVGEPYLESVACGVGARMEATDGRTDEAIALRRRELDLLAEIGGHPGHQAMALTHVATLLAGLGRPDHAAEAAADALRYAATAEPGTREQVLDHLAGAGIPAA